MLTTTTANGMTVLTHDGPAPYTAALVVGAGVAQESFRTLGVAHLVEHLVMGAQPRTALDVNAMVDDVTTVFHAAGEPDAVSAYLAGICRTIRDLPLDRLDVEAKVLDAEAGHGVHPALGWVASARFDARGVGLLGRHGPPHSALTGEHAREHVRRLFTNGNAVLIATGPAPEHPDLWLPEGPVAPLPAPGPSLLTLPAYLAEVPHPILSFVADRVPASEALTRLLVDELTEDLRHRQGLVYDIDYAMAPVDETRGVVAVWGDGDVASQHQILAAGVEALRRLADTGPSPADLAHHHAVARARMTDPRAVLDYLVMTAFRSLHGRPLLSMEQHAAETERVTVEDVRAAAAAAIPTLLVGGSEAAPDGVAGIPDRTDDTVPDCPPVVGRTWRRKLIGTAPRDLRIDADDEAVAVTVLGERHGGRWADLEGVAAGPWFRAMVFRDGTQVVVLDRGVKDAQSLFSEIDARAGALRFDVDEEWLDD